MRNLALAVVLALALGGALILLLGYLDDTVKTPEDVQRVTGKVSIGLIPKLADSDWDVALTDLRSASAEAFRGLRTNLQFATAGQDVKTILVTSVRPGEGKSTTLLHLGLVLAQAGQRVVLVDADLRRPQLHRLAKVANRAGLTDWLVGEPGAQLAPLLQSTEVTSLEILPTGPLPPNPTDVLSLPRMAEIIAHLESMADIVLIDSAPLAFSDALVLSQYVDGSLLVVESGKTRTKDLAEAAESFRQADKRLIGTILNKVNVGRGGYRKYEYYRSYYRDDDMPMLDPSRVPTATPMPRRRAGRFSLRRAS
jgi:non-specific protein-tyrosine kinase